MATQALSKAPSAVEKSAIRKIAVRLVPFVALMFFSTSSTARRSRSPVPTA